MKYGHAKHYYVTRQRFSRGAKYLKKAESYYCYLKELRAQVLKFFK